MRTWLFQGNPTRWPVLEALASGDPIRSWNVVRHLDLIHSGDRAVLWVSGPAAGVYAVGSVTGTPEPGPTDESWSDRSRRGLPRHRVPLELWTLPHPVSREELRTDPRFAAAQIIRAPRGGNPFPISDEQWPAIADRLPDP